MNSTDFRRAVRGATALLSLAAGTVHLVVIDVHFHEYWLFGWFFVVVALFQIGWGLAVLTYSSPRFIWLGGMVNGAVVVIWAFSRTTGLPLGPGAGIPQAITFADLAATVYEVLIVLGALILLSPHWSPRISLSGKQAVTAMVLLAMVLVPTTIWAVESGLEHEHVSHCHHQPPEPHQHPGEDPSGGHDH